MGVGFLGVDAVAHAHAGGAACWVAFSLDESLDEVRDGSWDFCDVEDTDFIWLGDANLFCPEKFFITEFAPHAERNFLVVPYPPDCEWQDGEDG